MSGSADGRRWATRRGFLKAAGVTGAGVALGAGYALYTLRERLQLATGGSRPQLDVRPYISKAEHLDALPSPKLSFYKQPWRGYLETVPATQFLSGIGINYALPPQADHEAAIRLLADSGFTSVRVEIGWALVPWLEDGLIAEDRAWLAALMRACKSQGILPLILLNAHHGAPGPNQFVERTVPGGGRAGTRELVLDSVAGLVAGHSGLSNQTDYWMSEVIFSSIEPARNRVSLSKPLPNDLQPGARVPVHTLKYLPLHPVGTEQLDRTLTGWLRYVDLVLELVESTGIGNFEVEIWNELTFGSQFLSINNYYDPPAAPLDPDFLHRGGQAWELGKRTVERVKAGHPRVKTIWGFSNTSFYHTPIPELPAGIDAQSYHPYGTSRKQVPADFPPKDRYGLFIEGYIPKLSWCMPEGWAHLGTTIEQLMRGMLNPNTRRSSLPPGASAFSHYFSEHGFQPREAGIEDTPGAQTYKAKALIRSLTFWLNKGISRVAIYTAYEEGSDDTGPGMLSAQVDPATYGRRTLQELRTPALTAMKNLVSQLAGAERIDSPRQLGVQVTAIGGQPQVFPGEGSHPALNYREMLTFLPFQVTPKKFAIATYVMSYDLTKPPPPMDFSLTISPIRGRAHVRYYDPIQGRELFSLATGQSGSDSIQLRVQQVDYPRLIVIEEPAAA